MPGLDGSSLVLVVDDEPIIADTLVMILNENGFDARAVYSGETAVVLARALLPDALISDVFMTGMTGVELAIQLCGELPNCMIILISGNGESADLMRSAEEDGHHFEMLRKPVHPDEILVRLKNRA